MAKVKIQGHASGTGVLTVTAPNTSTDRTITLPDSTGTLLTTTGSGANLTNLPSTSTADILSAATIQKTATANIGLGVNAVDSITTGDYNVGIGDDAGTAITTGSFNVALGAGALDANTEGDKNTVVGAFALTDNTTGGYNTAVGQQALGANTTGTSNVAMGYEALKDNTTGSDNVAVGQRALENNTTASFNTAMGLSSLASNTTGAENTALGKSAMYSNTTASYNTAVGYRGLWANTTGINNIAVGHGALDTNTTGSYNTGIGKDALSAATTPDYNTALGYRAGAAITSGYQNILIGSHAGVNNASDGGTPLQTGYRNILIGYSADTSASNSAHQICFGNNVTGSNSSLTFGDSGTISRVSFGGTSISAPSDQRMKEEIATSTAGLSFVNDLRPVTFKWKKEKDIPDNIKGYVEGSETRFKTDTTEHGFIAQEVKTVIDNHSEIKDGFDMWSADESSDRQQIAPSALIPILVKAVQELSAKVTALESE
jgi:trimeric autotransporter adhesin